MVLLQATEVWSDLHLFGVATQVLAKIYLSTIVSTLVFLLVMPLLHAYF